MWEHRLTWLLLICIVGSLAANNKNICKDTLDPCDLTSTGKCDVGFCCDVPNDGQDEVCTAFPTIQLQDGNQCGGDACKECPDGQYCKFTGAVGLGTCTDIISQASPGFACTENDDCSTRYCASDNTCQYLRLPRKSQCIDDEQCKSGNCENGLCEGLFAQGQSCDTQVTTIGECQDGLSCQTDDPTQNAPTYDCRPARQLGESCFVATDCVPWAACAHDPGTTNLVCTEQWSGLEGDDCSLSNGLFCDRGLKCVGGMCTKPATGNTQVANACDSDTCAEPWQQCKCNGETTACFDTIDLCTTQFNALTACLKTAGCEAEEYLIFGSVDRSNFPPPVSCGMVNCESEYRAYHCCGYCDSGLSLPDDSHFDCENDQTLTPTCDGSGDDTGCLNLGFCAGCPGDGTNDCCNHGTCTQVTDGPDYCVCDPGWWDSDNCCTEIGTVQVEPTTCKDQATPCNDRGTCNTVLDACSCCGGSSGSTCAVCPSGAHCETCTSQEDCCDPAPPPGPPPTPPAGPGGAPPPGPPGTPTCAPPVCGTTEDGLRYCACDPADSQNPTCTDTEELRCVGGTCTCISTTDCPNTAQCGSVGSMTCGAGCETSFEVCTNGLTCETDVCTSWDCGFNAIGESCGDCPSGYHCASGGACEQDSGSNNGQSPNGSPGPGPGPGPAAGTIPTNPDCIGGNREEGCPCLDDLDCAQGLDCNSNFCRKGKKKADAVALAGSLVVLAIV